MSGSWQESEGDAVAIEDVGDGSGPDPVADEAGNEPAVNSLGVAFPNEPVNPASQAPPGRGAPTKAKRDRRDQHVSEDKRDIEKKLIAWIEKYTRSWGVLIASCGTRARKGSRGPEVHFTMGGGKESAAKHLEDAKQVPGFLDDFATILMVLFNSNTVHTLSELTSEERSLVRQTARLTTGILCASLRHAMPG